MAESDSSAGRYVADRTETATATSLAVTSEYALSKTRSSVVVFGRPGAAVVALSVSASSLHASYIRHRRDVRLEHAIDATLTRRDTFRLTPDPHSGERGRRQQPDLDGAAARHAPLAHGEPHVVRAHAELPAQDVVPLHDVGQLDDGARPHAHAVAGDGVPVPSVAEFFRERFHDASGSLRIIDDVPLAPKQARIVGSAVGSERFATPSTARRARPRRGRD